MKILNKKTEKDFQVGCGAVMCDVCMCVWCCCMVVGLVR